MTRIDTNGTPSAESAEGRLKDEQVAAARVFDRLTQTIIDGHAGRARQRIGKTLVFNDTAGETGPYAGSTTNVHMAQNGRVLKVVALGRQTAANTPGKESAKAPASVSFAEGSVRASVAKAQFPNHTETTMRSSASGERSNRA